MANNRIYIRCNVCGKALFLGKDFAQGFYWQNYDKNFDWHLEDKLNEFFDEHTYCDQEPIDSKSMPYDAKQFPIPNQLGYAPGDFSIAYEGYEPSDRNEEPEDNSIYIEFTN